MKYPPGQTERTARQGPLLGTEDNLSQVIDPPGLLDAIGRLGARLGFRLAWNVYRNLYTYHVYHVPAVT